MHSHQLSEQQLLAAPMVTREKDAGDVQDVIVMLHDFSFRSPAELLAGLGGANAHAGHGAVPSQSGHAGHVTPQRGMNSGVMNHGGMGHAGMGHCPMGAGATQVHANDIKYDAYLANDRALDDPQVVRVDRGGAVRLRIIN